MRSMKTKTLTAAVLAAPLLLGCTQGSNPSQAADAASSPAASTAASASSTPSAVPSTQAANQSEGTQSAVPTAPAQPAQPSSSTAPIHSTLPAVEDPCAGACTATGRFQMNHPAYGPMEVVSYERVTHADTAPQGKQPSFAVYQGNTPVNYEVNRDATTLVSFGPAPVIGDQVWDVAGGTPVDKYGNLYLSSGEGVTVISPTDEGYSSNGTIPEANVITPYPTNPAGLTIDASGESTILIKDVAPGGAPNGKTLEYIWNGSTFVLKK
ncbi:hypothetical protein OH817_08325 [Kocuria rhizophila]|uniref:hypothetical protein n=1 Tax=Kocuria rhizophila TaxID=72000 RepID=UPI002ED3A5B5|nr:hypothetical protein OH817_08325 [Kocuria rhizophila]